jgi:HJR/Mrr/RecB family endonuclease
VANCCATRDLSDGSGGVVAAADVHRMELAALRDRFAVIAKSSDEIGN